MGKKIDLYLLICGLVGTFFSVLGILLGFFKKPEDEFGSSEILFLIGLLLFMSDLVFTLFILKERTNRIVKLGEWGKEELDALYELVFAGSTKKNKAHLYSGVLSIKELAQSKLPVISSGIKQAYAKNDVVIADPFFIYSYLTNISKSLPNGSIWIGTSKVNLDLWNEYEEESGTNFFEFNGELEERTFKKEMTVYRTYLLRSLLDRGNYQKLSKNLLGPSEKGNTNLLLKALDMGSAERKDFTILLEPPTKKKGKNVLLEKSPYHGYKNERKYKPICAIEYEIQSSSIIKSISVISNNEQINKLGKLFDKIWDNPHAVSSKTLLVQDSVKIDSKFKSFEGDWVGIGRQHRFKGKHDIEFKTLINIKIHNCNVFGSLSVSEFLDLPGFEFQIDSGYLINDYIVLHYKEVKDTMQFGTIILHIDSQGQVLEGSYLGYGSVSKGLISGELNLRKERVN